MNISALVASRADLYAPRSELLARYPADTVEKLIRIRDMHQLMVANPTRSHRELVAEIRRTYGVSEATAYSDLRAVREILPTLTESKRAFHRWRSNEMMMEIYRTAQEKGDLRTMERVASSYAKYNRVDLDDPDEQDDAAMPVQPFVATMDPSVLGIKPIPNCDKRIRELIEKYSAETIDIEDITYEEVDLQDLSEVSPTETSQPS